MALKRNYRKSQSDIIIPTPSAVHAFFQNLSRYRIYTQKLVMIPKMIQAKSKSKWNDKIYCRHITKSFTKISQVIWTQHMRTDRLVQQMGTVIFLSTINTKNETNPHKQHSNEELTYLYCAPESHRYTSSVVICLSVFLEGL